MWIDCSIPRGGNYTGEEALLLEGSKSWMTCRMTDGIPTETLKTYQVMHWTEKPNVSCLGRVILRGHLVGCLIHKYYKTWNFVDFPTHIFLLNRHSCRLSGRHYNKYYWVPSMAPSHGAFFLVAIAFLRSQSHRMDVQLVYLRWRTQNCIE